MIVTNKYYTIWYSWEALYSNLGTVVGTSMGATFLGCWNPTNLFRIAQREPSMSVFVELGSKFAEGFSDEQSCKMLFQHRGCAHKGVRQNSLIIMLMLASLEDWGKKGGGTSSYSLFLSPKTEQILIFYSNNQNYKSLFPLRISNIFLITCNEEAVVK